MLKFYVTIILGWCSISLLINLIGSLIGIDVEILSQIKSYFSIYVAIGFAVMFILKIKTPLDSMLKELYIPEKKEKEDLNKYNYYYCFKIFFMDIYYAMWWPYYIIKKIK